MYVYTTRAYSNTDGEFFHYSSFVEIFDERRYVAIFITDEKSYYLHYRLII